MLLSHLTLPRPGLLLASLLMLQSVSLTQQAGCSADADDDGWSTEEGDCNDSDASINPDASETCNDIDDNCDGQVDEDVLSIYYLDADQDGFGDGASAVQACEAPTDVYGPQAGDCNDLNPDIHPEAQEVCNGLDDNCDSQTDNDAVDALVLYIDADADGFGDPASEVVSCDMPAEGYVLSAGDCNDQEATVNPQSLEVCNQVDDNCDDLIDNNPSDPATWYSDADGDGYGDDASAIVACEMPDEGYVTAGQDCDDQRADVNPAAVEQCNGVDDNCSGAVDDQAEDATVWYADADKDGYGSASSTVVACTAPTGYVASAGDCNDSSASISPAAAEACDGVDTNCDGVVDAAACSGKKVFITSVGYTGNMGGTSGADTKCQDRARAAGLSGTFKAWLSSASSSPSARFTRATVPYVRLDGAVIANNWTDLTDGTLTNTITVNELGKATSFSMVYSYTRSDGTAGGPSYPSSSTCYGGTCTCSEWTSTATSGSPTPASAVGKPSSTDRYWTDYSFGNFCSSSIPLYCFEQ